MACKGTGTQPVASVAWSADMASSPLGSRMATRAAAGNCNAASAWAQRLTRSCVCAQVRLVQVLEVVSNARKASAPGVWAVR